MDDLTRRIFARFRRPPVLDHTIWFLGCSCVWGEAVSTQDTTPVRLSQLLGQPVDNLGIIGASPELITITYRRLAEKHTPKFVIVSWPNHGRAHMVDSTGQLVHLGPWIFDQPDHVIHSYPRAKESYREKLISGEVEENNKKLILEFESSMISNYFSFYFMDKLREFSGRKTPPDLAKDNMHPGPLSHDLLANWLYKEIKQQLADTKSL